MVTHDTPQRRAPSVCDTEVKAMHAVTGAYLTGSVPLSDAATVFRAVGRELGRHLAAPDVA
jgi:hypothetical protein